jgi:hypothetical protein
MSKALPSSLSQRWQPAYGAWIDFATDHPQLGYSTHIQAFRRFCMVHGDALIEHGALARVGKFLLADIESFGEKAFLAALGKLEANA